MERSGRCKRFPYEKAFLSAVVRRWHSTAFLGQNLVFGTELRIPGQSAP